MTKFTLPFGLALILFLCINFTSSTLEVQNLDLVGSWPFGISSGAIAVKDNYCFLQSGGGTFVIDVKEPSSPKKVAEIATGGYFDCEDDFLYVAAYGDKGLQIIDITNPSSPKKVGSYDAQVIGVTVISNSSSLKEAKYIMTPTCSPFDVDVVGNYAYIASSTLGLRIIDISNAANPQEIGFVRSADVRGVEVIDSYIYIADAKDGLKIIDITEISSPRIVGNYPCKAKDVDIVGNYAYILCEENIKIVDISEPASLEEIHSYDDVKADSIKVLDNYVYVVSPFSGLRIFSFKK